jgi:predicted  nucleic acid-binding Zn-ribbon protein
MADNQVTIEQISGALEQALKPVHNRLDRIEADVKEVKSHVSSIDETLTEVKIDLDIIKEDYIGQIEEIRSHVGMLPLIKHKSV